MPSTDTRVGDLFVVALTTELLRRLCGKVETAMILQNHILDDNPSIWFWFHYFQLTPLWVVCLSVCSYDLIAGGTSCVFLWKYAGPHLLIAVEV